MYLSSLLRDYRAITESMNPGTEQDELLRTFLRKLEKHFRSVYLSRLVRDYGTITQAMHPGPEQDELLQMFLVKLEQHFRLPLSTQMDLSRGHANLQDFRESSAAPAKSVS